jgi:hypothetical protein
VWLGGGWTGVDLCFALAGSSVGTRDGAPDTLLIRSSRGVNGASVDVEFWSASACIAESSGGETARPDIEVLLTIRLGGAFGSGARTRGETEAGAGGCGAEDWLLAATLPALRACRNNIRFRMRREANVDCCCCLGVAAGKFAAITGSFESFQEDELSSSESERLCVRARSSGRLAAHPPLFQGARLFPPFGCPFLLLP